MSLIAVSTSTVYRHVQKCNWGHSLAPFSSMDHGLTSINHTASIQGSVKLLHLCSETRPWS